jgi:hypothetical protein
VQLLGGRGDVEPGLGDCGEVAELVEFHRGILTKAILDISVHFAR